MRHDYHERLENRKEAYEQLADKADANSTALYTEAKTMASVIPFGQPIMVGHHSEKSDRNYRGRIENKFRRSFEEMGKAKHYAEKAETVGTGDVSSDDPEAIDKLREQLAGRVAFQDGCKADNAKLRKAKISPHDPEMSAKLRSAGVSDYAVKELTTLARVCCYQVEPHLRLPAYILSNNNAQVKRLEKRIQQLEAMPTEDAESVRLGVHQEGEERGACYARPDLGRIAFTFDGPPAQDIRDDLKSNGFRWSPREGAWLRHLHTSRGVATYLMQKWSWIVG